MSNPQPFLLDPVGKCLSCSGSPQASETVKCATCKEYFHALCEKSTDNNFICLKSFLKNWHSPSVKSNFEWNCDSCKTKKEENEVFTTENKFDQLFTLIKNLGADITEIKKDMGKDLSTVRDNVAELSSSVDALKAGHSQCHVSHANNAHPSPWENKEKVKNMKSSLVLKNKDGSTEVDESAQQAQRDRLKTLAVCNEIPVSRVGFDTSGNTYIDCPTPEDVSKLQPLLTEDFKDKQVSVVKSKLPCISIVGIEDEVTKSNLLNKICKQNPAVSTLINEGHDFSVLFVKKSTHHGNYTAVARVSIGIRNALKSSGNRVFLGVTSCKVYDRFYVKRCNKCQEYGHYKAECTNSACCAYCGIDHESETCELKDCTDNSKFSCINCKRKGLQHTGHTAFSYSCPTYVAAQNRLRKTIPYYDKTSGRHLNK